VSVEAGTPDFSATFFQVSPRDCRSASKVAKKPSPSNFPALTERSCNSTSKRLLISALQIGSAPAYHPILFRVGTLLDHGRQRRHLLGREA